MQIHAQCISSVWVCLNNCTILGNVLYSANTVFSWIFKISTGFMCYTCRQLGKKILINEKQEGQHPLTGQRATNFRLLDIQWAKRRQVTQWRHGYRAMRWSVCNAGASNAGRSLCIQISRERSYPLPIYSYHLKGNWLRYNFVADSFYIMKLCSRRFFFYCRNCPKDDKFR